MTLSQKRKYSNVAELKAFLDQLRGRKFLLECGHHITFGFHLGNDVTIINGKELKIICSQCGH